MSAITLAGVISAARSVPAWPVPFFQGYALLAQGKLLSLGHQGHQVQSGPGGGVLALRADAYIRPNEGARKVYLIPEAQSMNVNAQNAVLKLLEEGPAYAAFLLVTDNTREAFPAKRSRFILKNARIGLHPPQKWWRRLPSPPH